MTNKTWFIAGASRGLGRVWAEAALQRGDRVAVTARRADDIAELASRYGEAVEPIVFDVTDRAAVFAAFDAAIRRFGAIDVVVANAGYGLFGTLWVVQAALPHLRSRRGGHILATSSLAGVITFPTAGVYNATKWAVEGLLQTLAAEVAEFGIKVTLVEPGGYATDWRGASSSQSQPLAAYDGLRERLRAMSAGRALADPAATAGTILQLVDAETPPLRLFLGAANLELARREYAARLETWQAWQEAARAAQGGAPGHDLVQRVARGGEHPMPSPVRSARNSRHRPTGVGRNCYDVAAHSR